MNLSLVSRWSSSSEFLNILLLVWNFTCFALKALVVSSVSFFTRCLHFRRDSSRVPFLFYQKDHIDLSRYTHFSLTKIDVSVFTIFWAFENYLSQLLVLDFFRSPVKMWPWSLSAKGDLLQLHGNIAGFSKKLINLKSLQNRSRSRSLYLCLYLDLYLYLCIYLSRYVSMKPGTGHLHVNGNSQALLMHFPYPDLYYMIYRF